MHPHAEWIEEIPFLVRGFHWLTMCIEFYTVMGKKSSKFRRDRRGAVMVEYAFLLAFVVVPGATALLTGGRAQYQRYMEMRSQLLSPFP